MFGMNMIFKQFQRKYINSIITDDDIILNISRKFVKNFKENFPNHNWKHNVSINSWHKMNTKSIEYFMVDNKQVTWYDLKPNRDG